jgi:hypothetical protein
LIKEIKEYEELTNDAAADAARWVERYEELTNEKEI